MSANRSRQPGDGRPYEKVAVGYNAQVGSVDAKHKLIVEQAVTNQVVDMGLLDLQTVEPARAPSKSKRSTSSPTAATSRARTSRLARRLRLQFPTPSEQVAAAAPRCARACFARTSSCTTPSATPTSARPGSCWTPIRHGRLRDLKKIDYGNPKSSRRDRFPLRARDARTTFARSPASRKTRTRSIAWPERLRARPEILDQCREVVEHPFGSIKQWMRQGASTCAASPTCARSLSSTRRSPTICAAKLNILGLAGDDRPPSRPEAVRLIRAREASAPLSGRIRRPMGRKRPKFLPARSLRHSMPKSWSFRTVCKTLAAFLHKSASQPR